MSQVSPVADVPHIRSTIFRTNTIIMYPFFLSFSIMHSHSGCLFRVRFDSIATWRGRRWPPNFCIVLCFISISFGSFISIPINVHLFSSTFASKIHYANDAHAYGAGRVFWRKLWNVRWRTNSVTRPSCWPVQHNGETATTVCCRRLPVRRNIETGTGKCNAEWNQSPMYNVRNEPMFTSTIPSHKTLIRYLYIWMGECNKILQKVTNWFESN